MERMVAKVFVMVSGSSLRASVTGPTFPVKIMPLFLTESSRCDNPIISRSTVPVHSCGTRAPYTGVRRRR